MQFFSRTFVLALFSRLVCIGVFACTFVQAQAVGPLDLGPFVSGFERFGRHVNADSESSSDAVSSEVLVSELSCTACHASETIPAKGGPQLRNLARRVTSEWLRNYLNAPSSMKPGTTMPDVLSHMSSDEKSKAIDSLIAFLSTKQSSFPEIKAGGANPVEFEFWTKGSFEHGIDLYHESGCVACHASDPKYDVAELPLSPLDALLDELDSEELEEMGLAGAARRIESVPHGDLIRKHSRRSLTRFLYDPLHFRPGGRMPNMKLSVDEAADIAEYLLHESDVDDHAMTHIDDQDLIRQGQAYFQTLGCANCHQAGVEAVFQSIPLNQLKLPTTGASCLNDQPAHPVNYGLDEGQVAAIKRCIKRQPDLLKSDTSHFVASTLMRMNCYGCHQRDGLGGVGRYRKGYFETVTAVDLGDEGRLPPPLTGVGRKLKASWMKKVVRGDKNTSLRSHMTIRMPKFPHQDVLQLVDQIGKVDGVDPTGAEEIFGLSDRLGPAGQGLMEIGCIQCHRFDGQAMPGVIGIDLTGVPERVYPSWFRDFISNPGAIKKRTRMPTFFPDGKSQVPDVLDGQADQQIAAMWAYLSNHKKIGIPAKIASERAKDYELKPTEIPLILRTFMNEVGMHAIAVGFPQGTHYAFDGDQCQLAIGWREDFLDARSTWFERFSPAIDPLGSQSHSFPRDIGFYQINLDTQSASRLTPHFLGYHLDKERVPTFRYRCGNYLIEDRTTPDESGGLQRLIRCITAGGNSSNPSASIWFYVPMQKTTDKQKAGGEEPPNSITVEPGLKVQIKNAEVQSISTTNGPQWMVPLTDGQSLEVHYQW